MSFEVFNEQMLGDDKSGNEDSAVWETISNAEVMAEGRKSKFQPHECKFAIGKV